MTEEWRDIKGYEGWYQVSNAGRVRSVDRISTDINGMRRSHKGREIRQFKDTAGYLGVVLARNGAKDRFLVHRLVAEAFVANECELPQINHKDENKLNNSANNLEWCTRKYNINYGSGHQRSAIKHMRPVVQMTKDGDPIWEWRSIADAERGFGKRLNISGCCQGKYKTSGGFRWQYKELH